MIGDAYSTASQVTATAGTAASAAVTTAASAGAIAASTATMAVPIIGAAVLAVTLVLGSIARRNAQKTAATKIVNDVEPQLRANVEGYLSGPRTVSSQRQAIANFNAGWQLVLDNCGQSSLGSAGQRCISERQRGGTAPWCPTPSHTGCDWFALYLDPIANDTPNADPVSNAVSELLPDLTAAQLQQAPVWIAAGLIALGVLL